MSETNEMIQLEVEGFKLQTYIGRAQTRLAEIYKLLAELELKELENAKVRPIPSVPSSGGANTNEKTGTGNGVATGAPLPSSTDAP